MKNTLDELTELVRQLPGIGPRQARRLALFIVRKEKTWVQSLTQTMLQARSEVALCERCMRIFLASNQTVCQICANRAREVGTLMLVEKDVDLENIERTGVYKGLYFVLGGTTSALDKNPEEKIRINALEQRLTQKIAHPGHTHETGATFGNITEVIFALSATTEGEDTASYLRERLARFVAEGIRITLLGRGLSTGTELEYVDADTMRNALRGRTL